MTETIQLALLTAPVGGRLHLLLQGAVHALVPPVLLRVSGLDALVRDAELGPPHGQPRQASNGRAGKRRTVIGAYRPRQPILAEGGFKDGSYALRVGLLHRLAAQKITAPGIGDGQRIDAPSIATLEPALEIGAPDAVRLHRMRQRLGVRLGPATLLARHDQSGTLDDLAHRAGCRPRSSRLISLQNPLQLARTPAHVRLAQLQHCALDCGSRLVGMLLRSPVQFHQAHDSMQAVTSKPRVTGIAAYAKPGTKLPHRLLIALILKDKAQLLIHNTARFPGHNDRSTAITPRCSVGDLPGLLCRTSARFIPPETPYPPPPFIFRILMKTNTLHLQTSKEPSDNKELTRRTPSENRHFPPQNSAKLRFSSPIGAFSDLLYFCPVFSFCSTCSFFTISRSRFPSSWRFNLK